MRRHKAAFGAVGLIAALGVSGTAYAATNPGSSSPASSTQPASSQPASSQPASSQPASSQPAKHRVRTIFRRADHATLELRVRGQWVTYTLDRGKVTAISPTSITLLRPDGQMATETINAATRYKGVGSESAVRLDQPATVISDNGAALQIRQKPGAGA